jgi:CRP/FNR family transcriptional regulator, cyclic AMP receptor protein
MTTLEPILRGHPFFEGLPDPDITLITGCARNVRFHHGDQLAREGDDADQFFLIREGRVSLDIPAPSGGAIRLQTLDAGDVVGYSWLMPPFRWQFDVTALTEVRALSMDGRCLRGKCDDDPRLGYDLMKRFSQIMADRLAGTRLQLLDLYGANPDPALSHDE